MPLVAPNEGLTLLIGVLFRDAAPPALDWQLMLWVNDYTPVQATVLADLTLATFTGYSNVGLTRGTWTAPVLVGNKSMVQYDTVPITWIATGGYETVYGYAIYDPTEDVVLIAERFAEPVDLTAFPTIGVLPRVTLTTE